jgi:dipeptidyl aminopeptidase/acylaminoacyl peptidase
MPGPTPGPTATATPDTYAGLTIADLASRPYGGGVLQVVERLAVYQEFTRYLVTYPSDGLQVTGFMNVPNQGSPPYPVVIAIHGYIDPAVYQTLDYTTRYADALSRHGYLVLHPNLRGYPPSESGPNLFRVGMAVDVLNLAALVRQTGGSPGPLEGADPARIGLWGHSMGGGISVRVITVDPALQAAVLYGSMSGDERQNFSKIQEWSQGERGIEELEAPEADLARISAINFVERVSAAVSIHHGEADALVPLEWSLDYCERLQQAGKRVECFTYPGQPHTFTGQGDLDFIQRSLEFFDRYLGRAGA